MEQATAQYWMLMKRKQDIVKSKVSLFQARSGESWEERAFAEDHAAFMWPPRSYSCTFCKREFRSAQALGGHMNVHRRDRAMLKQSLHLPNTSPAPSLNLSSYSRRGHGDVDGDDHIETDLSVGCKRPKLAVSPPSSSPSPLEFLLKPCFQAAEKNVGLNKASSMEDLDLELRLGHHDPLAAGTQTCSVLSL